MPSCCGICGSVAIGAFLLFSAVTLGTAILSFGAFRDLLIDSFPPRPESWRRLASWAWRLLHGDSRQRVPAHAQDADGRG